jgi:beta-lactam-binding protein with PASTA domain
VSVGSTVSVWVSSGPSSTPVTVPRLIGMQQEAAFTLLSSLKLVPNIQPVTSDKPAGEVVDQSPKEGVTVAVNSAVTVMVSNSPLTPKVTVPSLINVPIDQATSALQVRGLTWSIAEKPDSAWSPNHVMAQSPSGGAQVDKGSVVHLTVAIATTTTTPTTTTTTPTTTTTAPPTTTTTTPPPPTSTNTTPPPPTT